MTALMAALLIVAGFSGVLAYLGFPVLIRQTYRGRAYPRLEPLNQAELPPALAQYLYVTANRLRQDGFRPEAYLCVPNAVNNVKAYLILLTNRAAGDMAMVVANLAQKPGQAEPHMGACYIEFCTEFVRSRTVTTNNSPIPGVFKATTTDMRACLPVVGDPHLLYQLHRHVIATRAKMAADDCKVIYEEGEAASYLRHCVLKSYEEQAELGLFYRDEADGETIFRPTWFGAFYMTWRTLWPVNVVRKAVIREQALRILREFQVTGNPPSRYPFPE